MAKTGKRAFRPKKLRNVIIIILASLFVPYGLGGAVLAIEGIRKSMELMPSSVVECWLAGFVIAGSLLALLIIGLILYVLGGALFSYVFSREK